MYCAAVRRFALTGICVVWPGENLRVIKGLGIGAGFGGGKIERVPEDDADCASRGRPSVCIEIGWHRLTSIESDYF